MRRHAKPVLYEGSWYRKANDGKWFQKDESGHWQQFLPPTERAGQEPKAGDPAAAVLTEEAVRAGMSKAKAGASAPQILNAAIYSGHSTRWAIELVEYIGDQWRDASQAAWSQVGTGVGLFIGGILMVIAQEYFYENSSAGYRLIWIGGIVSGPSIAARAIWWNRIPARYYISLITLRHSQGRAMFGTYVRSKLAEYTSLIILLGPLFLLSLTTSLRDGTPPPLWAMGAAVLIGGLCSHFVRARFSPH